MSFFHFNQNNTGGSFEFDKEAGITHHVIIEADSVDEANGRAQEIGIYFDGCESGTDCSCCGDRWSRAWDTDADAEPLIYATPASEYASSFRFMGAKHEACVHYKDGRKEWFA